MKVDFVKIGSAVPHQFQQSRVCWRYLDPRSQANMTTICIFFALLFLMPFAVASERSDYCHDPDAAKQWNRLLDRHASDPAVIKLYALRIGLCKMIDQGKLDVNQAIDIFEQERSRVIIERQQDEELLRCGAPIAGTTLSKQTISNIVQKCIPL